jgi:hypothetical protein
VVERFEKRLLIALEIEVQESCEAAPRFARPAGRMVFRTARGGTLQLDLIAAFARV